MSGFSTDFGVDFHVNVPGRWLFSAEFGAEFDAVAGSDVVAGVALASAAGRCLFSADFGAEFDVDGDLAVGASLASAAGVSFGAGSAVGAAPTPLADGDGALLVDGDEIQITDGGGNA